MADEDESKKDSALSLTQLIGAPIRALVEAEAQAAMATANFIRSVGFVQDGSGNFGKLGDLQMASFLRKRRNAQGEEETVEVQIPLLTMLPIPALQIRDAEQEYTVKILDTELSRSDSPAAQQASALGMPDVPATLRATLARDTRSEHRRSLDMLVKMKVNIEQSDMPAGLAKLLSISAESVNQRLVQESEPAPASGSATARPALPSSGDFTI